MNFFKKLYALVIAAVAGIATPVLASPSIDDIWTAADFGTITAKAIPMAVALVGLGLIGLAVVVFIKYMNRAKAAG